MLLSELLNTLEEISKDNGISVPYIVGGLPRDRAFGFVDDVKDVDITTGDEGSIKLAVAASKVFKDASFGIHNDKHSSIDFKNIRVDFSSNFILPGIQEELVKLGVKDISNMHLELYSRDFTVNTLLQPMDLSKEILDLTGLGLSDVHNKILRTPINPEMTIGHDPKRILRAIKLSIKYDLEIEEDLKKAIVKYRGGLADMSIGYIKKQINQMLKIDVDKTIDLLTGFQLLPLIPISKLMMLETAKKQMVQHILDGAKFK